MSVKNVKVNDFDISTNIYFNSIKKNKSLTKQEENELWNKFHKKKDLSAREKLIKANAINLNAKEYELHYLKDKKELIKCIH